MAESKLTLKTKEQAAIRMYGQGFGDCFLLAFPRKLAAGKWDRKNPVYVVIDCGVFYNTPQEKPRMQRVVQSLLEATGGRIDLLVVTHEHHDHLCGFERAREQWAQIAVDNVWVAWTEDPTHPKTKEYDREHEALRLGLAAIQQRALAAPEDSALRLALDNALTLQLFATWPPVPDRVSVLPDKVMDSLSQNPATRFRQAAGLPSTTRTFCEPGQVRVVPASGVDAYVLGPPTDPTFLSKDFDKNEVYHEALRAVMSEVDASAVDPYTPFSKLMGMPYEEAQAHPFFAEHYFAPHQQTSQIESEWLQDLPRLALQMDELTNNTSLVLAFRLPDGRVLLFPGDAQVGNWLSWDTIKPDDWHRPEGGGVSVRPTAAELLARTAVYKVGHHGSHNATLEKRGLERMPDGVIAFVPSSRRFPQHFQDKPWKIPFPPLVERLSTRSQGRLVFPHSDPHTDAAFQKTVEASPEQFPPMERNGEIIEDSVPVWRQVRLK
jgi:hypothetical protein